MDHIDAQTKAIAEILEERNRQNEKWGEQNHDPFTYLTIFIEEAGEFAESALHSLFGGSAATGLYGEAVQMAAVAMAIVESLNRDKWTWPVDGNAYGDAMALLAEGFEYIDSNGKPGKERRELLKRFEEMCPGYLERKKQEGTNET